MSRDVVHDGAGSYRVRFPFDRRLVELVKSLPRRRWHAVDKVWLVPDDDVVPLVDALQPEGFAFDDEALGRYASQGGARTLRRVTPSAGPSDSPAENGVEHWTVGRLNREVKAVLAGAFPSAIWLVGEMPYKAQDTGLAFFRYLRANHPEIDAYYFGQNDLGLHGQPRCAVVGH